MRWNQRFTQKTHILMTDRSRRSVVFKGFVFIKVPFDEALNYRINPEVKLKNKPSLNAKKSLRIRC